MTGDELVRIASQDTLEAVRDRIGETGDTGPVDVRKFRTRPAVPSDILPVV